MNVVDQGNTLLILHCIAKPVHVYVLGHSRQPHVENKELHSIG